MTTLHYLPSQATIRAIVESAVREAIEGMSEESVLALASGALADFQSQDEKLAA